MSKTAKTRLLKYGLSTLFCLVMAGVYLLQFDFDKLTQLELYKALCDAFTFPGALLILVGLLLAVSNEGALDGIGYVLSYAVKMLIPGKHGQSKRYYDYVEEKRSKRVKGYGFLFIVGGISMAVALVFLALFYSVYSG